MKELLSLILFFIFCLDLSAQSDSLLIGKITFTTSEHIYARFNSTDEINLGDTLFINNNPCLIVSQKSSTSCVCIVINNCEIIKHEEVVFVRDAIEQIQESQSAPGIDHHIQINEDLSELDTVNESDNLLLHEEKIRGRLSASTYSNISPEADDDRHRIMLRASLNARHINNSKFSIESYLNYRHNILQSNPGDNQTKFFRIYNLATTYDANETTRITFGRKINRKLSSVGAIDGLQFEKQKGNFFGGVIAGFRPDIREFDFNTKLFQYGGYIGHQSTSKSNHFQTTVGFLEQRNGGLDRRYVYMQHRSSIGRKLSFFGSMELDIYGRVDSIKNADPRLTNLFLSSRYRFSRKVSLSVSYDNRKRIIYYETLRTDIERLLADDEARQGIRMSIYLRPIKYVSCGATYSRRFQQSEANKSNNANAFVTHNKLPGIKGSLSLRYNLNSSNYLESQIISVRYTRSMLSNKLSGQLYFRNASYSYYNSELTTAQQYYGVNLSFKIGQGLRLSLLSELADRSGDQHIRVNTKLIKRFYSKKNK